MLVIFKNVLIRVGSDQTFFNFKLVSIPKFSAGSGNVTSKIRLKDNSDNTYSLSKLQTICETVNCILKNKVRRDTKSKSYKVMAAPVLSYGLSLIHI